MLGPDREARIVACSDLFQICCSPELDLTTSVQGAMQLLDRRTIRISNKVQITFDVIVGP